jgi:hypothetical protein
MSIADIKGEMRPFDLYGKDGRVHAAPVGCGTSWKWEQTTHNVGVKYDTGKPEYGLIPPYALDEMVKVLTAGAQKYSADNWRKVDNGQVRYFNAMQRHVWAWKRGEHFDPETGLHHLAHAACCLYFLMETQLEPSKTQPGE